MKLQEALKQLQDSSQLMKTCKKKAKQLQAISKATVSEVISKRVSDAAERCVRNTLDIWYHVKSHLAPCKTRYEKKYAR